LTLNQGEAPINSEQFSDIFTVYTAKRFPGMTGNYRLFMFLDKNFLFFFFFFFFLKKKNNNTSGTVHSYIYIYIVILCQDNKKTPFIYHMIRMAFIEPLGTLLIY